MERVPAALSTPEDEIAYLRAQIEQKEAQLAARDRTAVSVEDRARIIDERVAAHHAAAPEILDSRYAMSEPAQLDTAARIMESLHIGGDEVALRDLIRVMEQKGVKNALSVIERLNNPKLGDDFHRFLVRYLAAGLPLTGIERASPRFRALNMTLYEIALPEPDREEPGARQKTLKELVSAMEQFYAGLLAVERASTGEPAYFALELAVPAESAELEFYAAVPNSKRDLFEKQLLAVFPTAHLVPQPDDYNIFTEDGVFAGAVAHLAENPALPLKDYTDFDYDPLNAITNAFAKIEHAGEGAALQIIVEPRSQRHVTHYAKILQALRKGEHHRSAFSTPETVAGEVLRDFGRTIFSSKPKDEQKAKEAETRQIEANKTYAEQVEKKITTPIVGVTLRLAVSSKDSGKAEQVLGDLEASFNQFANTAGNRLVFDRIPARRASSVLEDFSFRVPDARALPLSLRELTGMYHFPPQGMTSSPHLKQSRTTHAPAPLTLPKQGVLLGYNEFRGVRTDARLAPEDRLRHVYAIGQTGAGKTGLLKGMIVQDIQAGDGCCFIDPHGNDIYDVLAAVPPERYEDVIYFDPANLARPFGLNFLEYDLSRPEQKTFIVNELLMIFRRLYGDVPESMGPAFEQYFRNAALLVMEDPASGSTMLDIARVLSNGEFRRLKLSRSMNPIVNQFWTEIATKAGGEAALENIVPYITNKFDDFIANDFIRPIVGQQESSFNFRDIIDRKKILLINLSKGRLGERNANLLGLIVVGKLFMAALSRADSPGTSFAPFYLYIDEFQNITTDSIPGILSEARKYRLSLTMAHQFLGQLDDQVRDAVFGNVGNMAVFRVGEEDAEFFEKQFAPAFEASDFVNLENRSALVRLLAQGLPQKPFDIRTADLPPGNRAQVEDLVQLSSLTYGRDRASVENMIRERYITHAHV